MRLAEWNFCGRSNVSVASWARRAQGDSVSAGTEAWVRVESVTNIENIGPRSFFSEQKLYGLWLRLWKRTG